MTPCVSCGSEVPDTSRFCPQCGGALSLAVTFATRTVATPAATAGTASQPATASSSPHGRFVPGTLITGRYRIVSILGKGGMGEVYRADDLTLGQSVALKFLPMSLSGDPDAVNRFRNEVRVARLVSHPNVCRVHDLGEVQGQFFLSMEYIDGEDLASLLRRIGRMPDDKALEIARKLCAGLAAAHEKGILHRDLKPGNVMLDARGQVLLTDFGLSGIAEELGDVRSGTPAYMAPEQLAGKEVTVRSDIYALGLLLYEVFTGKAPLRGQLPGRTDGGAAGQHTDQPHERCARSGSGGGTHHHTLPRPRPFTPAPLGPGRLCGPAGKRSAGGRLGRRRNTVA